MEERTAGIDLASEEHRLVVVEASGRRLEERRYSHSEEGITALVRRLLALAVCRVAIERPNGLVVDRLLDAGISVVAVHPNQLAASRDRYRSGGGKSDGFDAYVLAELARTDMHRFRLLTPDGDETRALRALTRAREDLVEQRVALANQLRAQLEAFLPGAARLFADVDSPICLAFLERYPSPADAHSLGAKRLAGFLARNSYPGRRNPSELLNRLREAPAGRAGELESEARRTVVLALVTTLKPLVEQIKLLTSQITGALNDHSDAQIFRSLFRDPKAVVTAAELLAEIGDRRDRHPASSSLEAIAGQAPIAVESGKKKVACFRWACNKNLRSAASVLADSSRKHNPLGQRHLPTRPRPRPRPPTHNPHPQPRLAPRHLAPLARRCPLRPHPPRQPPTPPHQPGLTQDVSCRLLLHSNRSVEFDRDADDAPPLRPRAVVDADVLVADELVQREPSHRRAMAQAAVGDHLVARSHPDLVEDAPKLIRRPERPVLAEKALVREVTRAGDVASPLGAVVERRGDGRYALAPVLLRRAEVQDPLRSLTHGVEDSVATDPGARVLVAGCVPYPRVLRPTRRHRMAAVDPGAPTSIEEQELRPPEHLHHPKRVRPELERVADENDRRFACDPKSPEPRREDLRRRELPIRVVPEKLLPERPS